MIIDKSTGFLVYTTTQEDIAQMNFEYERDFKESNRLNKRTVYEKKESRLAGIIGEIVFYKYTGKDGKRCKSMHYDNIFFGKTVDVKCKLRNLPPQLHFEASDFLYQNTKDNECVDFYAFLSTIPGYKYVWFCAWADHDTWWRNVRGQFWGKGKVDPSNHKEFHEDTWSVRYKDLQRFRYKEHLHNL